MINQSDDQPFGEMLPSTINRNNQNNISENIESYSVDGRYVQNQNGRKMSKVSKVLSTLFCESPRKLKTLHHHCKMTTFKNTIQDLPTITTTSPTVDTITTRSFDDKNQTNSHNMSCSNTRKSNFTKETKDIIPEQSKGYMHRTICGADDTEHHQQQILQVKQTPNVFSWIQNDAPQDLIPKIFIFAGPRTVKQLSCLNSKWRELCLSEAVWQTFCEDYHKIDREKEEQQLPELYGQSNQNNPIFWRQYYIDNPIVPIDFDTVESAFNSICSHIYDCETITRIRESQFEMVDPTPVQVRKVRILLSPGTYVLEHPLVIYAITNCVVILETLKKRTPPFFASSMANGYPSLSKRSNGHKSPLEDTKRCMHDLLSCQSTSSIDAAVELNMRHENENSTDSRQQQSIKQHHSNDQVSAMAKIIYQTDDLNDPVVYVRQGTLHLRNVQLLHDSPGTDIWNGNSAIQIQPPLDHNDFPIYSTFPYNRPTAILEGVDIKSTSGRGVVVIDGGMAKIRRCHIHNCAATGVYVGGRGSEAFIHESDIIRNGFGSSNARRGIGRGHSGVYLEQGVSTLIECNISHNSYTGISAISPHNARLRVENSDLVSNGSVQIELPPVGSMSRNRSLTHENNHDPDQIITSSRSGILSGDENSLLPGSGYSMVEPIQFIS